MQTMQVECLFDIDAKEAAKTTTFPNDFAIHVCRKKAAPYGGASPYLIKRTPITGNLA